MRNLLLISRNKSRASLNIQRAVSGEKIFRQSKQKSARIVHPIRRIFVTNDGKDAADSPCDEFLEPPIIITYFSRFVKSFFYVASVNKSFWDSQGLLSRSS